MARIDTEKLRPLEKDRNSIHEKVFATYTVFDKCGDHYVQIDTYGREDREIPEKISQSIQFDKYSAREIVDLLTKEFNL